MAALRSEDGAVASTREGYASSGLKDSSQTDPHAIEQEKSRDCLGLCGASIRSPTIKARKLEDGNSMLYVAFPPSAVLGSDTDIAVMWLLTST